MGFFDIISGRAGRISNLIISVSKKYEQRLNEARLIKGYNDEIEIYSNARLYSGFFISMLFDPNNNYLIRHGNKIDESYIERIYLQSIIWFIVNYYQTIIQNGDELPNHEKITKLLEYILAVNSDSRMYLVYMKVLIKSQNSILDSYTSLCMLLGMQGNPTDFVIYKKMSDSAIYQALS